MRSDPKACHAERARGGMDLREPRGRAKREKRETKNKDGRREERETKSEEREGRREERWDLEVS